MSDFNKDLNKTLSLIKKAQQKQSAKDGQSANSSNTQTTNEQKSKQTVNKASPPQNQYANLSSRPHQNDAPDNYVFTPYGKTVTPPLHKNQQPKKQKVVTIKTPPPPKQQGTQKSQNKTVVKVKTMAKKRSCWGMLLTIFLSFIAGFSLVFFAFPLFMDVEDGCFVRREQLTIARNLFAYREANPIRPIDSRQPVPFIVEYGNRNFLDVQIRELWELLECGNYRPDFNSELTENVSEELVRAYNNAKRILDRYILNSYTPFQRARVINEYLTHRVVYDQDLFLSQFDPNHPYFGQDISFHASFNLTGALNDGVAVCYGFSESFKLMAIIEGMNAEIVFGDMIDRNTGMAIPHAWNKIELSETRWYNVDVTSNILHIDIGGIGGILGQQVSRIFHQGFFLVSDTSIMDAGHAFLPDGRGHIARYDFDFYSQQRLFEDQDFSMLVTSVSEFNEIFDHIRRNRRGEKGIHNIELQLDIFGGFDRNPEPYFEMFRETFRRVRANFDISLANPIALPRNAFIFLIYNPIF
ncbi:MAG: hypothetical protein FWC11_01450 [Firmicutes bacterium]|nr:hypothetical protein [Bacillota bacterium]